MSTGMQQYRVAVTAEAIYEAWKSYSRVSYERRGPSMAAIPLEVLAELKAELKKRDLPGDFDAVMVEGHQKVVPSMAACVWMASRCEEWVDERYAVRERAAAKVRSLGM